MNGDIVERLRAEVVPCSGKGWDGNGVQHCAECCFGTGVVAATADELQIMLLARDAADEIERLRSLAELTTAEVERMRAAGDAMFKVMTTRFADDDDWYAAIAAWQEARRG